MPDWAHPVTGEVYRDLSPRESALIDVIAGLNRAIDGLESRGVTRERELMACNDEVVDLRDEVARLRAENENERHAVAELSARVARSEGRGAAVPGHIQNTEGGDA